MMMIMLLILVLGARSDCVAVCNIENRPTSGVMIFNNSYLIGCVYYIYNTIPLFYILVNVFPIYCVRVKCNK